MVETWRMIHTGLAGISLKWLLVLGSLIGAATGSIITEFASTSGFAGGVYGAVLTTALLILPKVMEQFRKKKETDHNIAEDSIEKTTKRLSEFYQLQITDLNTRLNSREQMAALRDLIANLERQAKHDVLDQLTIAEIAIREFVILTRSCPNYSTIPTSGYKQKIYKELCGQYDDEITNSKKKLAELAVTS